MACTDLQGMGLFGNAACEGKSGMDRKRVPEISEAGGGVRKPPLSVSTDGMPAFCRRFGQV